MSAHREKRTRHWFSVAVAGCVLALGTLISGCGEEELDVAIGAPQDTGPEVDETTPSVPEIEDVENLVVAVVGNRAELRGSIEPDLPAQMQDLVLQHPEVDTLVLLQVGSSGTDTSEMDRSAAWTTAAEAAQTIREAGLATVLPADGHVVDAAAVLFAAGVERRVEVDAERRIGRLEFGRDCCGEVGRRSFQQLLGPDLGAALMDHLGAALMDHLDAVGDGSNRDLSPLEVDLFGLSTTPLVLGATTTTDQGYGFVATVDPDEWDGVARQPDELLAFLVDRFNDAQDPDEEGLATARTLLAPNADETRSYVVIEGGLDDSIGGVVIELLLQRNGAAGWSATESSIRPICWRGVSDNGLCR